MYGQPRRVAPTNPVNIYGLLGILRVVGAGLRARPFKISFSSGRHENSSFFIFSLENFE